jgi:hypothetical protein
MQKHQLAGEAARRAPSWYLARGDQRYGPLAETASCFYLPSGEVCTLTICSGSQASRPGNRCTLFAAILCSQCLRRNAYHLRMPSIFPPWRRAGGKPRLLNLQVSVGPSSQYPLSVGVPTSLNQLSVQACWIELKDMRRNASSANASWYRTENSRAASIITLPGRLRSRWERSSLLWVFSR